jgi:hypothetical protein
MARHKAHKGSLRNFAFAAANARGRTIACMGHVEAWRWDRFRVLFQPQASLPSRTDAKNWLG